MDRINSANTTDIGGGNRGFKDENIVAGTAGTDVSADHMNATQEEILKIIEEAGLVPDDGDWTQLWQAFQVMFPIANNPVFPEIETATNVLAITDNANGTITIDAAQTWLWRGMLRYSSGDFVSGDRTLAHAASKTHHVYWNSSGTGNATPAATYPRGRFEIVDMTAAAPVETDDSYDTTFDRMLIAKIVTDGANAPTITLLQSRARMEVNVNLTSSSLTSSGGNGALKIFYPVWNLSRTPNLQASPSNMTITPGSDEDFECHVSSVTRYSGRAAIVRDHATTLSMTVVGGI